MAMAAAPVVIYHRINSLLAAELNRPAQFCVRNPRLDIQTFRFFALS
jgi:hypothetical protein